MITTIPASVPNTVVKLCDVGPGVGSVTITVAAANTVFVYVGTSNAVSATNGAPICGTSTVVIPTYAGSRGATLYAIASVAGPTPVGVFLSNAQ